MCTTHCLACGNVDRGSTPEAGHMRTDCTGPQEVLALFALSQVPPRRLPEFGNLLHSVFCLKTLDTLRPCRLTRHLGPFRW